MDIVAFLTSRLDEDQALAEAAHEIDPAPWSAGVDEDGPGPEYRAVRGNGLVIAADEVGLWDTEGSFLLCMTVPTTRHVAHWDPARVLREVAVKRRVLARHHVDTADGSCDGCGYDQERGPFVENIEDCPELRDMASVYSDHPDFDPTWAVALER